MQKQIKKPMVAFIGVVVLGLVIYFSLDKGQNGVYYGEVQSPTYDVCASVPGIIKEISVQEGDAVSVNMIVMKLDSQDAQLSYDKAKLAEENAKLQSLKSSSPARSEELTIQYNAIKQLEEQKQSLNNNINKTSITLKQYELTVSSLKEAYEFKLEQHNDVEKLYREGFESKQNLDLAKLELTNAKNAYENAKLQLESLKQDTEALENQKDTVDLQISSAKQKLTMMNSGLDSTEQQVTANQSQIAELDLERAELLLRKYDIISCVEGIVESVNFEKGEYVGSGAPVISVVDKTNREVTLYVQEKDLPKIKLGDKLDFALVSDDSVRVTGMISKISEQSMYTPMNIVTTKDRDRLVFPVVVTLESSDAIASGMLLKTVLSGGQ